MAKKTDYAKLTGMHEVPLAKLKPNPDNARKHPPASVNAIMRSLERFKQYRPLVARAGTMVVLCGNGTLKALKALKARTAWVNLLDVDDKEAAALALADNRLAELGEWDNDALTRILHDMDDGLRAAAGFLDDDMTDLMNAADGLDAGGVGSAPTDGLKEYIICSKCGIKFLREDGLQDAGDRRVEGEGADDTGGREGGGEVAGHDGECDIPPEP